MCLNYCLKILLAWFGIKFDPLILNKKSAEKNASIIFALQKKYEFYGNSEKIPSPKNHQKLLDGRDFRFTSFFGGNGFKHLFETANSAGGHPFFFWVKKQLCWYMSFRLLTTTETTSTPLLLVQGGPKVYCGFHQSWFTSAQTASNLSWNKLHSGSKRWTDPYGCSRFPHEILGYPRP